MSVFILRKKCIGEERSASEVAGDDECFWVLRRILVHFYVDNFVDTTDLLTTMALFDIIDSIVCTDCLNLSS